MKKINTHGIRIDLPSLRNTARSTTDYGQYSPNYHEVFYDRNNGEVWSVFQSSIGHNSWTVYHDPNVIKIGNFTQHVTQQELIDCIRARLGEEAWWTAELSRGEQ